MYFYYILHIELKNRFDEILRKKLLTFQNKITLNFRVNLQILKLPGRVAFPLPSRGGGGEVKDVEPS